MDVALEELGLMRGGLMRVSGLKRSVRHAFFTSGPRVGPPRFAIPTIFILIYVDDILVTGSSLVVVQEFIKQLGLSFALKDLGSLHYFLGIEVSWLKDNSIHLSQAKYIKDLLRRTNMNNSKP